MQSRLICFLLFPICRAFRAIRNEQKSKKWRDISVDVQRGREGGYFRERDLRRGRAGNLLQTFRIVEVRGVRREEPGSRQEAQHQQHTRLEPWKVVAEPHPGQGRSLRVRHYSSRPETGTSYEKKRSLLQSNLSILSFVPPKETRSKDVSGSWENRVLFKLIQRGRTIYPPPSLSLPARNSSGLYVKGSPCRCVGDRSLSVPSEKIVKSLFPPLVSPRFSHCALRLLSLFTNLCPCKQGMEEGVRKKGDRWIEGRTRGETVGTFWPLSRNFACSERSKGVCIYIYIYLGTPRANWRAKNVLTSGANLLLLCLVIRTMRGEESRKWESKERSSWEEKGGFFPFLFIRIRNKS